MMRRLFTAMRIFLRGLATVLGNPATSGLVALTAAITVMAATSYWIVEDWTFLDALYFSVATISTVGHGDVVPETAAGRIFTMAYIFVGIGVFVTTVASIAEHVISTGKAERENRQRQGLRIRKARPF